MTTAMPEVPFYNPLPSDDLRRAADPKTPASELAALACDLRMAIWWAVAQNPTRPQHVIHLLMQAGASNDLAVAGQPARALSEKDVGQLAGLGPWGEQLAVNQPKAGGMTLAKLADSPRASLRQRIATHGNTPGETLAVLALDQDEQVRQAAAQNPAAPAELLTTLGRAEALDLGLSADRLEALAALGHHGRVLAARHPNTPRDLLEKLARDDDWQIRAGVAHHPLATADMLAPLLSIDSPDVHSALAAHPHTPGGVLAELAKKLDVSIRLHIAAHPNAPASVLARLIEDGDTAIRTTAKQHPQTPTDALARLEQAETQKPLPSSDLEALASGGHYAKQLAAKHPDTPIETLHRLAADIDPFIREHIAARGAVPGVLIQLGSSPDLQGRSEADLDLTAAQIESAAALGPWARILAARHPNAGPSLLDMFANDEHWQVRKQVARHASTPDETKVRLSTDPASDVRWSLVKQEHLPGDAIKQLMVDEHAAVRMEVALHPDTPMQWVELLTLDRDEGVRSAAETRLKPKA